MVQRSGTQVRLRAPLDRGMSHPCAIRPLPTLHSEAGCMHADGCSASRNAMCSNNTCPHARAPYPPANVRLVLLAACDG